MDDELLTVSAFAAVYQVDTSEVRRWIRMGAIPYELVGPRKMKRIRPSMAVKLIEPKLVGATNGEPGTKPGSGIGEENRARPDQKPVGQAAQHPQAQRRRR